MDYLRVQPKQSHKDCISPPFYNNQNLKPKTDDERVDFWALITG